MSGSPTSPLVAVDIGNSRMKFGLFDSARGDSLPEPLRTLDLPPDGPFDALADLASAARSPAAWRIASVHRRSSGRLLDWLRDAGPASVRLLSSGDLPLNVALPRPDMVGIDRLLGAVAANCLRPRERPAVIVHFGSAITVNLVDAVGAFRGGAILPGIGMSAKAMHYFTDLLPLIDMQALDGRPAALGTDTWGAMTAGLYWGAVGGAKEIVARLAEQAGAGARPLVILTGGAAPAVAPLFADDAVLAPHLVLAGIAIAAGEEPRL